MSNFNKKKLIVGAVIFLVLIITVQIFRGYFGAEEKRFRIQLRETLQQRFPVSFERNKAGYGLQQYSTSSSDRQLSVKTDKVILVHGLDDPGLIWQNLAPMLIERGYRVWIMSYPNDQPICDSAYFFELQLELFAAEQGTDSVAIISHSMGGLVTREMLTNPSIGYERKITAGIVPDLTHFIMVGTPNHGSFFSRLRFFTEVRDQLVSAGKGKFQWLRSVFDGMGEAGIDLYPGSEFLKELNRRPLPSVEKMLIVAGIMSPWEKKDIKQSIEEMKKSFPESTQTSFVKFQQVLVEMIDEVGDGLVSVDSASLPGVPLLKVQGTHVSIIRNLIESNKRIPPAIPIILRELEGKQL